MEHYPQLIVDSAAIQQNAAAVAALCAQHGVRLCGVIKGAGGDPRAASAMWEGGCTQLASSRLDQLRAVREVLPQAETLLIRMPQLWEAPQVVRLFIKNDTIIEYGTHYLRGLSLGLPFFAIDILIVSSVFNACGMGGRALLFALLRKVVLQIPLLILLNRFFPPYGIAYAELIAELRAQKLCSGVHIMAVGAERHVPAILEKAGITI